MNLLDYIVVVFLLCCLVRGVFRGLIKELSSIVGALGGFYAGYTYYPWVSKWISPWVTHPTYSNIVGFMALFIGVCIVVAVLATLIKYLMKIAFLGWVDRIGGACVGTAKGMIIIIVIVLVLTTFLPASPALLKNSRVAKNLMRISATVVTVASQGMKNSFMPKM